MSIAVGTRLGQYEIQDFIGQGAMGLVYRAYHPDLERTGAVKVLQAITPDTDTVARFRHEAQAIAQLRHPNIVNVYDFGAFQGMPYMIVEYVPGGSLAARMAHGRLDQATALKYLRGIAAGLDYAHAHGVVHRDVKPANVLLTAEDAPVLADFGLAKLLQGSSLKSMTGVTTGTPAYMAPEQVAGHQVGPAADRYSLATIAYEMLTGVIPFDGEGLMELLYAQVHREPVKPSSRLPLLSPAVDGVIMRALAKDPAARWSTATAFVDALAATLDGAAPPHLADTMVMPPAMASTVPIARAAAKPVAPKKPLPETVAVEMPVPLPATVPAPAAADAKPKRLTRRRIAIGVAALLILLLALGVCNIMANATTLTVTPNRTSPGDTVTVKATNVPANQVGEIQLWSIVHTYPFRADANGNVTLYMTVPLDIALGDHTVKICWSNSCHKQAPLRVVAGVAEVLPSPTSTPSPGASASSTPRATPTAAPTTNPTQSTGSTPHPTPTSHPTQPPPPPTAKPTPTPQNPCPGSSNAAALAPATQAVLLNGNATISGSNFTPNSSVTISYYAPSGSATPNDTWTVTASCSGMFAKTFATKPTLIARTDRVVACDVAKGCTSATINILL